MKTWFADVGVEDLEGPAESHDLILTESLWDKMECVQARASRSTLVPDLANGQIHSHVPKPAGKTSQRCGRYCNRKERPSPCFSMRNVTSTCVCDTLVST